MNPSVAFILAVHFNSSIIYSDFSSTKIVLSVYFSKLDTLNLLFWLWSQLETVDVTVIQPERCHSWLFCLERFRKFFFSLFCFKSLVKFCVDAAATNLETFQIFSWPWCLLKHWQQFWALLWSLLLLRSPVEQDFGFHSILFDKLISKNQLDWFLLF